MVVVYGCSVELCLMIILLLIRWFGLDGLFLGIWFFSMWGGVLDYG